MKKSLNYKSKILKHFHQLENPQSPKSVRAFLRLCSWGYKGIVGCKNLLYHFQFIKAHKTKGVVISIGNISVGGTGKTPTVEFLAKELQKKGIKPAILSRGYRSQFEHCREGILCADSGPLFNWWQMGDEPYLLSKKLPHIPIWISKNRINSAEKAIQKGSKVLILDDGLQHRKLHRDYEIITMQCADALKSEYFLPRGPLRDSYRRLKGADLIILHNVASVEDFKKAEKKLQKWTHQHIVGMRPKITQIVDLHHRTIPTLKDEKVGIFCALGAPKFFEKTLDDLGAHVVNRLLHLDHYQFTSEEIQSFAEESMRKGAKYLVCTEKDRIKIFDRIQTCLPIFSIEIDLQVIVNEKHWKMLIEKIFHKMDNRTK